MKLRQALKVYLQYRHNDFVPSYLTVSFYLLHSFFFIFLFPSDVKFSIFETNSKITKPVILFHNLQYEYDVTYIVSSLRFYLALLYMCKTQGVRLIVSLPVFILLVRCLGACSCLLGYDRLAPLSPALTVRQRSPPLSVALDRSDGKSTRKRKREAYSHGAESDAERLFVMRWSDWFASRCCSLVTVHIQSDPILPTPTLFHLYHTVIQKTERGAKMHTRAPGTSVSDCEREGCPAV